ncbi:hypothetical protein CFB3_03870 [Clostridium folliculivorans]|uniref:Uncharacterized protein n=1 Tax=Clostridium folliculivorans TaxID=2886038 RepID=A0A9W6DAD5_9CLOT|nr:hypothetical protein CFOLD11_20860 [Clostridium folliculivorans]GKU28281.1 hypothetical protein CFB3_03870 [Clostridium folliculivorans]
MRAELLNSIHVFLILIFFIGFIAYTIREARNCIRKFKYNYIKRTCSKYLDFSRFMIKENYFSYEKYDIWRYCELF